MTDSAPGAETTKEASASAPTIAQRRRELLSLEICFLAVIGLIVVLAFVEATSYKIVSSRTPFVIMVPLFALIAIQAYRLSKRRNDSDLFGEIRRALSGSNAHFSKVVHICGWMVALLLVIMLGGHLVGINVFSFALMWWIAKEKLLLSAGVALVTTALLYLLFEFGFDIELYKGMIYRYFAGYRVF